MTLVEVMAGLTLFASLVAGMLVAFGSHQRQIRLAERRMRAVALADRLLVGWYTGAGRIPPNRVGSVAGSAERWLWRTTVLRRRYLGDAAFDVIRLEVMPRGETPLAAVDLLVAARATE